MSRWQAFTNILNAGENVTSDNMTQDKYEEIRNLMTGFNPQNLSLTTKANKDAFVKLLDTMIDYEKKNPDAKINYEKKNPATGGRRASKHSKKHRKSKKSRKSKKTKSRRH